MDDPILWMFLIVTILLIVGCSVKILTENAAEKRKTRGAGPTTKRDRKDLIVIDGQIYDPNRDGK